MREGIIQQLDEEAYHADPDSISKSGLWTMISKTPAHFRYAPARGREPQLDVGSATHLAILQPELAATRVVKGPPDRRGNRWKDALAETPDNAYLLPAGDYDGVMIMADQVRKHPVVQRLTSGTTLFEASGFWTDERTGIRMRCRPDSVAPEMEIMGDLKTTADASAWNWSRTAGNLGYHMQEHIYSTGWPLSGGCNINAFVFIVVEAKAPYCTVVYELDPSAVTEGRALFEKALDLYKKCMETDEWPGYPTDVVQTDIPNFAYRETEPQGVT